jgi:cytochrome P450
MPYIYHNLAGHIPFWQVELHEKYGEVVRFSPNEISFSSGDAWKDLYGHKKSGQPTFFKNPKFYQEPVPDEAHRVFHVVNGNDADHSRMRRIFSNAFSDRALKLQEPMFMNYMDLLVDQFKSKSAADPGHKFNMVNMYNFTTFDVMADLTFGESMGMIARCEYHPWIAAMMSMFRFGVYLHSIRYYQIIEKIAIGLLPRLDPKIAENQKLHEKYVHSRVDERLAKEDARPDIWGLVLEKIGKADDTSMTRKEMYANANLFMIAGTETTATLLSGLTHYLLVNPDKLKNLCTEIRESFPSEDEITIEKLQTLKYLHGCIEEGLRMYPPISTGLPRVSPPGGAYVDGHFVPEGVSACVPTPHPIKDGLLIELIGYG